ncbi:MAG: hypothetical protein IJM25_03120 [Eubacterium sp.]|nr:hypothetical protein [Eubacterium sp.]
MTWMSVYVNAKNCWLKIDGKWYRFDQRGYLAE